VTLRHAYDANGNIWADLDGSNNLLARYVYGDRVNQIWARAIPTGLTNAGIGWYSTDRQGSVRDIMNNSGVIGDHIEYDGFGNATHSTISVADSWGYAGGWTDYYTGWIKFGQRWYRPSTGDWASEDPSGFDGGVNLYEYCGNDATNRLDPSGMGSVPIISYTAERVARIDDKTLGLHGVISAYPGGDWSSELDVKPSGLENAIIIRYNATDGTTADNATFIQFVWSQAFVASWHRKWLVCWEGAWEAAHPSLTEYPSANGTMVYAFSDADKHLSLDYLAAGKHNPGYVESGGIGYRSDNTLVMVDKPSVEQEAKTLLKNTQDLGLAYATNAMVIDHFDTYAVDTNTHQMFYRVSWTIGSFDGKPAKYWIDYFGKDPSGDYAAEKEIANKKFPGTLK
jgi:RHS repeat-associated protein